jgi:hypothetical protein
MQQVFCELTGVGVDKDTFKIRVPPHTVIKVYLDGTTMGPSKNDLANYSFTDIAPANNNWNRAILSMIALKCIQHQDSQQWVLPEKPHPCVPMMGYEYWEDMVYKKWIRIRVGWMKMRQKLVEDPILKTWVYSDSKNVTNVWHF